MAPAYFEDLFGATRPGLADYWREVSYGQISLAGSRMVGWYTLPRPSDRPIGTRRDRLPTSIC